MKDIQEHMNQVDSAKEVFKPIDTVDIHGKKHPTYAGVLKKAHEQGIDYIKTKLIQAPLAENHYMAIVHATVALKEKGVFSGIGDATPKNVNSMIAPHIVRMAETRAKGRALRDALNISEALQEEMGGSSSKTKEEGSYNPPEAVDGIKCPKCDSPLVEGKTKTGKTFHKCSTQTYKNGVSGGCDYVNWEPEL